MKEGGRGGHKTLTGLRFESRVNLKKIISSIPEYEIIGDYVYFEGKKIAGLYQKHKLYKNFLERREIDYRKIISKKLLPDDAIFLLKDNTLFIIEIKFQKVAGSVDEKLQTCDFKNKQYKKLFDPINVKVKYVYVLNDWFKKGEYRDVLNYVESVGCYYFFYEIPFNFLGLPKP